MERNSSLDDWQKFWDREKNVEDIYPASDSIVKNLIDFTDIKNKKILEVGAGTGRESIKLSLEGADVTVIDYADNALYMVKEANSKAGASLNFIQGDGTKLPFTDGSFDIVFHQGLLEHFREPLPLVHDNIRVLKPGGLLLIDVPQKYHIYTVVKQILIIINKWFAGWETQFSIMELRKTYRSNNLTICREYGDYMVPSLFYRVLREILKIVRIRLPMYPGKVPGFNNIRKSVKSFIIKRPFMLNTYLTIGIIGKKE